MYVGLSGIRRGLYINTRVSPLCFEQGERTRGYTAGAAARREDLWFSRGSRSSVVDYARGGRGDAKGSDKINRHSLSLVESSLALVNIDFPLTEIALSQRTPLLPLQLQKVAVHSIRREREALARRVMYSQSVIFVGQWYTRVKSNIALCVLLGATEIFPSFLLKHVKC